MNKLILAALLLLLPSSFAGAQDLYNSSGSAAAHAHYRKQNKRHGFERDRLILGGAPVLGFGSGSLALGVAPIAGYRFTDHFMAGIGLNYTYFRQNDYYTIGTDNYAMKEQVYSGSVWARYLLFGNFFGQVEYEHNFINYTDLRYDPNGSGNIESYWVKYNCPSLLVGGGYRSPISGNASLVMMVLYDVLQNKLSPYYGTVSYRFGINVGF